MRACFVMLPKGVADPLPASLKDVNFCRLLSRAIPQILFADDVWPAHLKNPSEAGADPGSFFRRGCTTKEWRN